MVSFSAFIFSLFVFEFDMFLDLMGKVKCLTNVGKKMFSTLIFLAEKH